MHIVAVYLYCQLSNQSRAVTIASDTQWLAFDSLIELKYCNFDNLREKTTVSVLRLWLRLRPKSLRPIRSYCRTRQKNDYTIGHSNLMNQTIWVFNQNVWIFTHQSTVQESIIWLRLAFDSHTALFIYLVCIVLEDYFTVILVTGTAIQNIWETA